VSAEWAADQQACSARTTRTFSTPSTAASSKRTARPPKTKRWRRTISRNRQVTRPSRPPSRPGTGRWEVAEQTQLQRSLGLSRQPVDVNSEPACQFRSMCCRRHGLTTGATRAEGSPTHLRNRLAVGNPESRVLARCTVPMPRRSGDLQNQ